MNRKIVIAGAVCALIAACGEDFSPPPAGKEPIGVIGKGDLPARYYLMEQERMPNGRLHAVVLQQFKNGRPGMPIGYQIDCSNGPRWFNNGGDTLAALRAEPVADDRMTLGEPDAESTQIARWLCDK